MADYNLAVVACSLDRSGNGNGRLDRLDPDPSNGRGDIDSLALLKSSSNTGTGNAAHNSGSVRLEESKINEIHNSVRDGHYVTVHFQLSSRVLTSFGHQIST
jgi:hypothetical protein